MITNTYVKWYMDTSSSKLIDLSDVVLTENLNTLKAG